VLSEYDVFSLNTPDFINSLCMYGYIIKSTCLGFEKALSKTIPNISLH
jgi:hypothetical protein